MLIRGAGLEGMLIFGVAVEDYFGAKSVSHSSHTGALTRKFHR